MMKWDVKYQVQDSSGKIIEKFTDVYGKNVFEAYLNAQKILKIIERNTKILKCEIVQV